MQVHEVMMRALSGEMHWFRAADILGVSARTMRRWREEYERRGCHGFFDRRRAVPSPRRGAGLAPSDGRFRKGDTGAVIGRALTDRRLVAVPPALETETMLAGYSARSAASGSIRLARRAGINPATADTAASSSTVRAAIAGSVGGTP